MLTDPVAFRYLEEDPSTTVLERRRELNGYECYIVEQWATSRTHPTFVITTYTGDQTHTVVVGVLSVPTDEAAWSPRLRVYFKALNQYHARRRETALGILMVTNLSNFPSSLTVIPVPDGDLRKHRFDFFVNENLKRLGCSGRVGLTLVPPTSATVAKFHQLYRTSDKNALYKSVIELVKLCQAALTLFAKLEIDYADGLLCDVTEKAINDWWVEVGSEYYNIEPHDGILGPTTVAALLGLLMGARNRLNSVGAPVAKDAFDVEAMKRGIGYFQKQQRIDRSRRLDRHTLDRLHRSTAKAASGEGWTMPRAVKSTVAELSGKGGEMVMDVVGRRDKAGIAEIETPDIERFVQLVSGERCKWLWYGKPLKKTKLDIEDRLPGNNDLVFKADEQGGFTWAGRKSTIDGRPAGHREASYEDHGSPDVEESEFGPLEDPVLIRSVMKRATGLRHDARSGLGRIKEAVAGRGHQSKPSKDDSPTSVTEAFATDRDRPALRRAHSTPIGSPKSPRSPTNDKSPESTLDTQRVRASLEIANGGLAPDYTQTLSGTPEKSQTDLGDVPSYVSKDQDGSGEFSQNQVDPDQADGTHSDTATAEPSIAGSIYNGVDLNEVLPAPTETAQEIGPLLRRTLSSSHFVDPALHDRLDEFYPRHLSFSLAEESVLTWTSLVADTYEPYVRDAKRGLAEQELRATDAKALRHAIAELSTETASWTQDQLRILRGLLAQADRDQQVLDALYYPHLNSMHSLQTSSEGVLRETRERMEEGGKEVETLAAKLDYEIGGLKGKVEDVEAGVGDFEKGVLRVEDRVKELERLGGRRRRVGWGCIVS